MAVNRPLRIALIAGEASGDVLGASLIQAIAARHPDAEFFGIGGPKMMAAGLSSAYEQEKLAVRGAIEVLKHLPEILSIRRGILAKLKAWKPDVMIGIDAPDFNLPIERQLKRAGIPTVHYVSPTVWAWRRGRAKKLLPRSISYCACFLLSRLVTRASLLIRSLSVTLWQMKSAPISTGWRSASPWICPTVRHSSHSCPVAVDPNWISMHRYLSRQQIGSQKNCRKRCFLSLWQPLQRVTSFRRRSIS